MVGGILAEGLVTRGVGRGEGWPCYKEEVYVRKIVSRRTSVSAFWREKKNSHAHKTAEHLAT